MTFDTGHAVAVANKHQVQPTTAKLRQKLPDLYTRKLTCGYDYHQVTKPQNWRVVARNKTCYQTALATVEGVVLGAMGHHLCLKDSHARARAP